MSKYDKEREALGVKPSASSVSGQSKYATERAQITPLIQANRNRLDVEQSDMAQMDAASRVAAERSPIPENVTRMLETDQSDAGEMAQSSKYAQDRGLLKDSRWNVVLDNPIVHGAGVGLKWISKPFETISTGIADAGGAINNLLGTHTVKDFSGNEITLSPSQKRNFINDTKDIWSKTDSPPISSEAWQGTLPNLGKMPGTTRNWTDVIDFAAQSIGPGEIIKPLKYVGKIGELTESGAARKAFNEFIENMNSSNPRAAYDAAAVNAKYAETGALPRDYNVPNAQAEPIANRIRFMDQQMNGNGLLGLPESKGERLLNQQKARANQTGEGVIYGQGRTVYDDPETIANTFGLPAGNYVKPQRLKVTGNDETLDSVMRKIRPIVTERMTPPLENPTELARYVQQHVGTSMNELRRLSYNDLVELATEASRRVDTFDMSVQVARELGYDLPRLLEGKGQGLAERVASDAQKRTYGIYPERVNIRQPEGFNVSVTGDAAAPRQQLKVTGQLKTQVKQQPKVEVTPPQRKFAPVEQRQPLRTTVQQPAAQPTMRPTTQQTKRVMDEPEFIRTVKESENTAQGLVDELNTMSVKGARTTDILNRQEAGKLIEKHGMEGLYSKLLGKRNNLSASESTAAQILAKHYSSLGGKENMERAIELVSKTAREGREMGQAIQALSQWNKLDQTGALLLGERQLNRGVSNTAEWKSLTPEQAMPITAAAQRIEQAQETKSLADEVLSIVTNKNPGEALTDAEKSTIKQFQQQVKEINEKAKPFLPKPKSSAQETIEKVSKVAPKERTRDQVVNFLEAKAELARKRLEKQRNIGFAAQVNNPVLDYAIIGAAEFAKGIRNFADYSEAMVRSFGQAVQPHLKDAYLKSVNIFRRENGLPTVEELEKVVNHAIKHRDLGEETAKALKVWATEIGFIADKNLKLEATQDLQLALKDLGRSTLGQKVNTIESASMLLNVPTFLRNTLGNAGQMALEKINKLSAVPFDWSISKITGERTIQFLPNNQESMWRNFMIGTKSGWEGVSPTGTLSSYDINPNVFGNKNPFKYLSKALGASLQGADYAAYRSAYGDVVATYAEQMGKSQGLSKAEIKARMPELIEQLDQSIHELADQAGLYATYQDETLLSRGAQGLKRALNKPTDMLARSLVEKGLLKQEWSWEGYGAGDILVKFARTPANLVMRGIDYSPVGFVRAAFELAPLVFNRAKFDQFKAVRALSRATTGTLGLTGFAYVLADAGILTGSASADKDKRSIQEQSGEGAYKVNWSALSRWMLSGFDKSAAKYQKGDQMFDYAWVQPAAISLAMGVNANQSMKEMKPGEEKSTIKLASDAILGGLRSVLENPMVTGLTNVVDATTDAVRRQSFDGYGDIVKGVPARFVPTLSNQIRTSVDNNQRETFDENILKEMLNMVKNKIPGLSKTLPVSYNSLGQPRERIQGGEANTLGQYLTSLLSPVKSTKFEVTPEAKLVLDVLNDSLDSGVLPRVGDKYIMVDDPVTKKQKRVDLTKEEFSKLQQVMGTNTVQKLKQKEAFLSNPNISAEKKAAEIKKILSEVGQRARNEVRAEMGYKKKQIR